MTYVVHLVDFPDVPDEARSKAEERFRRALDKALGERVEPALKAFENASDSSADELSEEEFVLANAWAEAYTTAKAAGFRDLGEADGAFFEVRFHPNDDLGQGRRCQPSRSLPGMKASQQTGGCAATRSLPWRVSGSVGNAFVAAR